MNSGCTIKCNHLLIFVGKTFLVLAVAFCLAMLSMGSLMQPVSFERGLVVHLDTGFLQDMLDVRLRGKTLDEIRDYINGSKDEILAHAQIAQVSDLFHADAQQKFGISLMGFERRKLMQGRAFTTNESNIDWAVSSPDVNLSYRDPHKYWVDFDMSEFSQQEHAMITPMMLVLYTQNIMKNLKPLNQGMRRPIFIVVPIAETPYVLYSRRPEPLPPEIPRSSLVLATAIDLLILFLATMIIILPLERRVRRIGNVCRQVTQGEYSVRCNDKKMDAVGQLAHDVDIMTVAIDRNLNQQKSLLQAVSHEIRTPLSRIRFAIAMIDVAPDDPKGEERIDSIDDDLTEIDNMLKELSYFNYVDAGKGREHFEEMPIQEMVDDALRQRSMALEPFDVRVDGSNDEMVIMADRTAFKRVIGNLLSNAARYAKEKIQIKVQPINVDKIEMIEVAVEDDGIGIPEDKRETVFEPFITVDPSRSKSVGGVGLGLAICHRIMRIHHGRIFVDSSALGGARMVTQWPIHQEV